MLLEITDLQFHYGRIQALRGVKVAVGEGELVALVGANGAGKSTLMRAISGVHPVSGGTIRFDGADITALATDARVKRGISQVPEGRQVFAQMSVEDNLRLGAATRPKAEEREDIGQMFDMFPILKERRKQLAGTLSGGEQQMLAIGRALMARPRLLLMDEPSMGLSPMLVDQTFETIERLSGQGTTIFLVEQNAYVALSIATRGYVLEGGCTTLTGTGQELLNDPRVKAAYLGT
ncbi:Branched-chain amino acid transport ATP-binding protein LivF (TC 3.A.1.4.1) [hydrothermal vent metagenome]|uniref:Branched-chain amino acid transport ATP-binding protein LivF (TC 3.A.1.4.1) n=1 Tax=hydrothermal vent metagenome TaxID=652676 RepID=A0A3B0TWK2_9ZZZZ